MLDRGAIDLRMPLTSIGSILTKLNLASCKPFNQSNLRKEELTFKEQLFCYHSLVGE